MHIVKDSPCLELYVAYLDKVNLSKNIRNSWL